MAAFHSLQYIALNLTSAVNVSLILAITPVTIPVMAWIFWRDRMTLRQGGGILLSLLVGGAIITRGDPLAVLSRGLFIHLIPMFATAATVIAAGLYLTTTHGRAARRAET